MFDRITLQNFQSHKHSVLELSPGVNVIIGESDSGKSALLRAIYWMVAGRPSGDSMWRHRANSHCVVQIAIGNSLIERVRGNGDNYYKFNNEVYKGFGQNVPEPVINLFNMTELNFMRQMDPPFLFSKTSGEVAQYLNRLIDLEVIDLSLSNIKRMHTQAEHALNSCSADIFRLEKELTNYDWLNDANKKITKLEKKEARIKKLKQSVSELDYVCKKHAVASNKVEQYAFSWKAVPKIEAFINWKADLAEKKEKYNTLRNAILYAQKTKAAAHALPNTNRLQRQIVTIENRYAKLQASKHKYNGVRIIVQVLIEKADSVQRALARHKQAVLQLQQAMPNVCPLCDQPIRRK